MKKMMFIAAIALCAMSCGNKCCNAEAAAEVAEDSVVVVEDSAVEVVDSIAEVAEVAE